ncbi:MAG: hypothetical protein K8W52_09940 [Deltaproteobacteria bacterium]|nr:hypothetical protein [Deltaproteobacteria bacterium]
MRLASLVLALVTALPVAACGDRSAPSSPDAMRLPPDGNIAPPDASADARPAPACDFAEAADATNAATAEATGLTIDGTVAKSLCGTIGPGQFADGVVDTDNYTFTVTGAGVDLLVRLDSTVAAGDLAKIKFGIGDGQKGVGVIQLDHGSFSTNLPAGTYTLYVTATNGADAVAAIPYTVKFLPDAPATRCPRITAAASYTEAHDGASSADNDVVYIDYEQTPIFTLTPATTDAPEPTGLAIAPATSVRIAGAIADVDVAPPNGDVYTDRDTFAFETGPATNELEVRLDWAGTADMDVLVFNADSVATTIGAGTEEREGQGEFITLAVKPSTKYWIWTGAYDGSTPLPAAYDLSICGKTYAAN